MSVKAMSWAFGELGGDLGDAEAVTLLALADYADNEGVCWPGVGTLAERLGKSQRQTRRLLASLREKGFVTVGERRRDDGSRTSNLYCLMLDTATPRSEVTGPEIPANDNRPLLTTGHGVTGHEPSELLSSQVQIDFGVRGGDARGGRYPDNVKRALPEVKRKLDQVARIKTCPTATLEALAKAMAAFPDRDFVAVADEMVFWAEHGNGSRKKVKALAGTWRNFLRNADPAEEDPQKVAQELDALDALPGTAVEL